MRLKKTWQLEKNHQLHKDKCVQTCPYLFLFSILPCIISDEFRKLHALPVSKFIVIHIAVDIVR